MGPSEPDRRETDRLLEQELREAVGEEAAERAMERADDVRAAHATPGTPAAQGGPGTRRPYDAPGAPGAPAPRGRLTSWIVASGPLIAVSFAVFLTIGVILSLATGSWWTLVAALAVHALGTLVVATAALRLTTETEHVSPALAARLEEDGVASPDRAFTELAAGAAGPGDVVREGRNERTAAPEDDASRAAREQRTAFTPGSGGSAPSGARLVRIVIAVAVVVVAVGAIGLLISVL